MVCGFNGPLALLHPVGACRPLLLAVLAALGEVFLDVATKAATVRLHSPYVRSAIQWRQSQGDNTMSSCKPEIFTAIDRQGYERAAELER